jgi:hypothetical protein
MNLYAQVVTEAKRFLPQGEDVDRFVTRQCRFHLKINSGELSASHIPELARWIGCSAGLLIPKEQARILRVKIEALAKAAQQC